MIKRLSIISFTEIIQRVIWLQPIDPYEMEFTNKNLKTIIRTQIDSILSR